MSDLLNSMRGGRSTGVTVDVSPSGLAVAVTAGLGTTLGASGFSSSEPPRGPLRLSDEVKSEMTSEAEQHFIIKLADAVGMEYGDNAVEWTRRGVTRAHVDFLLAALSRVCGS